MVNLLKINKIVENFAAKDKKTAVRKDGLKFTALWLVFFLRGPQVFFKIIGAFY